MPKGLTILFAAGMLLLKKVEKKREKQSFYFLIPNLICTFARHSGVIPIVRGMRRRVELK